MISAVRWVPRGIASEYPLKSLHDGDNSNAMSDDSPCSIDQKEIAKEKGIKKDGGDDRDYVISKYNLDTYDSEPVKDRLSIPLGIISPEPRLSQEKGDDVYDVNSDTCTSELEEIRIDPTDNLILIPRMSNDFPSLEVYVREASGNIYIHHDIILSDSPFCIERVGSDKPSRSESGHTSSNYAAIGLSCPRIEIWDLDIIDAISPELVLGPAKRKISNTMKIKKKVHTGSVVCLAWNKLCSNILVSGSTDSTVKLWDLMSSNKALCSYSHHKSDVQAVSWHPLESTVLMSGSTDSSCSILDTRAIDSVMNFKTISNVECVKWDPFDPNRFCVGLENGTVVLYDIRENSKPLTMIDAHDQASTTLDMCPFIKNLLSTGSVDGTIKIWNLNNDNAPSCAMSKSPDIGRIFSVEFSPDESAVLLAGGCKGMFVTWDLTSSSFFRKCFSQTNNIQYDKNASGFNKVTCPSFSHYQCSDISTDD